MTNLNAVLQTYFVDADINAVIDSATKNESKTPFYEEMDSITFQNLFLEHNSMYGTDVVRGISQLANNHWRNVFEKKQKNIFEILAHATKNVLQWNKDEPICKYDEYLRWNDISTIVGEDLLTTAYLALRTVRDKLDIKSFAWKPHITPYNLELSNILNKGLSELHYHMFGSTLAFDVTWLSLMNSEKIPTKKLEAVNENLPNWIEKARAARIYLFQHIQYGNGDIDRKKLNSIFEAKTFSSVQIDVEYFSRKIENERDYAFHLKDGNNENNCIDYALHGNISELDWKRYYNVPLIGERKLLYKILKKIYRNDGNFEKYLLPLHVYILVKNKFRKYLIQNDAIKGFSHFQEIQGRKDKLIDNDSIYSKLFSFMAMQTTIGNQPIKKLEMRIGPCDTPLKLVKLLRKYNADVNSEFLRLNQPNIANIKKTDIGYIIHFLKKDERTDKADKKMGRSISCRNCTLRQRLNQQAEAIWQLVHNNSMYVKGGIRHYYHKKGLTDDTDKTTIYPIVGIDAASSEFGCRPEVFAPVFRRLKQIPRSSALDRLYEKRDLQLGRTFHVGEDFYDIVDGLRAIDECIFYLNFGCGDRLGHAVALGIDAYDYYKTRTFDLVMPRQILLDNAVWLLKKIEEYSIQDKCGLVYKLKNIFETNFYAIYDFDNCTIDDYYASWMLRGDEPSRTENEKKYYQKDYLLNNVKPVLNEIRRHNTKAKMLYKQYHYSKKAKDSGDEIIEYQIDDSDARIILEVQEKMRKEIAYKKIAIETNPTSNMRITDLDRYSKHPVIKFFDRGLKPNSGPYQINASINTDDQGVFATSLEKEYALIACALEKKRDKDGNPEYSPKDIYDWLDKIRESASICSFLNEEMS